MHVVSGRAGESIRRGKEETGRWAAIKRFAKCLKGRFSKMSVKSTSVFLFSLFFFFLKEKSSARFDADAGVRKRFDVEFPEKIAVAR